MKLAMLLQPVEDMAAALHFYGDALGLPLMFRDGERFAALDAGGLTLALVAGAERIVDVPALAWRVDDIDAALARLVAAGAQVLSPPARGPHERRAVLRDVAGHPLVLSAKLRPPAATMTDAHDGAPHER
jgi:predicted enzyme related to lactoylglutathione lyase